MASPSSCSGVYGLSRMLWHSWWLALGTVKTSLLYICYLYNSCSKWTSSLLCWLLRLLTSLAGQYIVDDCKIITAPVAIISDCQTTKSVLSLEHGHILTVMHSLPPVHEFGAIFSFMSVTLTWQYNSFTSHRRHVVLSRLPYLVTVAFSTLSINILTYFSTYSYSLT